MFQKLNHKESRWIIAGCGIAMVVAYFTPLWYITLAAPQYPEGLSLYIWIKKITGGTDFDLQNINLLNHYIGMQKIAQHSIPELLYMPYVLLYMIVGAFLAVLVNRLFMVYLGLINLTVVALAGLYDFWRWEHDFGHNLSPDAPIKMDGMTYQPPLIACKTLLNIQACSWPHIGVYVLIGVGMMLAYIIYKERFKQA